MARDLEWKNILKRGILAEEILSQEQAIQYLTDHGVKGGRSQATISKFLNHELEIDFRNKENGHYQLPQKSKKKSRLEIFETDYQDRIISAHQVSAIHVKTKEAMAQKIASELRLTFENEILDYTLGSDFIVLYVTYLSEELSHAIKLINDK